MKLKKLPFIVGLAFGLASIASAGGVKVRTSGSAYGATNPTGSACGANCTLPGGVTGLTNSWNNLDESGATIDTFEITSNTSNVIVTLTGSVNFAWNSADYPFGSFVCGTGSFSANTVTPPEAICGNDPTGLVTTSPDASSPPTSFNSVTFTIPGSAQDFVFFVSEGSGGTVHATVALNTETLNADTAPEPALFPIVGLGIAGLAIVRRRRSANVA